jgi:IMP dehydrogenase
MLQQGYELSDVMLIPRSSEINSRDEPDISVTIRNHKFAIPIIASPMRGIVGPKLIIELAKLGGLGILHRFWENENKHIDAIGELAEHCPYTFGISTGLEDDYYTFLSSSASVLVLDVANGYLQRVIDRVKFLRNFINKNYPDVLLIAGNVVTYSGAAGLVRAGADIVRVGIGSGQLCLTRTSTGVGYPQFSALQNIYQEALNQERLSHLIATSYFSFPYTISDGGIKYSGDMAKALAAGANFVMLGSILATTYESEADGTIYGMASAKLAKDMDKEVKSVEGMEITAPEKTRSLEDLIHEFSYGLKSCMTYTNARDLIGLRTNAEWITTGTGSLKNAL